MIFPLEFQKAYKVSDYINNHNQMVKNYLTAQEQINTVDLSAYIGTVRPRTEWNQLLSTVLGVELCYINPQKGIVGNTTGTVSIKSTEFGKLKYAEDNFRQDEGFLYYETQTTKKAAWDDEIVNKSIYGSSKSGLSFLVFKGETKKNANNNLKLLGLGTVHEIFVATLNKGKSAIFKIKINS